MERGNEDGDGVSKARIILAEDDSSIRKLLAGVLTGQGYEVEAVEHGGLALELVESGQSFDLVITDIQMPVMNGLELIAILSESRPDLPVVVVTGYGDRDLLIELIRLGCDDFVQKPVKATDFLVKVGQVVEMKRHREEAARQERAEMTERNTLLAREAEVYAKSVQDLRTEIAGAKAVYQDLIQLNPGSYKVHAFWKVQTYKSLGGDYIGIRNTPQGCDVLVADVAGHDLAASYHTVLVKAFFDRNFHTDLNGKTFFQVLNRELHDGGRNERMVTAMFLRLDLATMRGELVAAGHPRLVRIPAGTGRVEPISAMGTVLGVQDDIQVDPIHFDIAVGDRFFLYTDGLLNAGWVDGPTGVRRRLGEAGLDELLAQHAHADLEAQVEGVWDGVMRFCRYKQN
ncbi:MAG: response regulator, partial [Proteobacteria bacterium]|nr:response regulator [Pseudomonadota bacterium]